MSDIICSVHQPYAVLWQFSLPRCLQGLQGQRLRGWRETKSLIQIKTLDFNYVFAPKLAAIFSQRKLMEVEVENGEEKKMSLGKSLNRDEVIM